MAESYSKVIPLNKTKLWILVVGAALFVVLGFIFILYPDHFRTRLIPNGNWVIILGFACQLVFGYYIGTIVPKLKDKKMGIRIDKTGIFENSSEFSIGEIPWRDISGIHSRKIAGNRLMVVEVKDPSEYMEKAKKRVAKKALSRNNKIFQTPIVISVGLLKCKFKDLEEALLEGFNQFKGR